MTDNRKFKGAGDELFFFAFNRKLNAEINKHQGKEIFADGKENPSVTEMEEACATMAARDKAAFEFRHSAAGIQYDNLYNRRDPRATDEELAAVAPTSDQIPLSRPDQDYRASLLKEIPLDQKKIKLRTAATEAVLDFLQQNTEGEAATALERCLERPGSRLSQARAALMHFQGPTYKPDHEKVRHLQIERLRKYTRVVDGEVVPTIITPADLGDYLTLEADTFDRELESKQASEAIPYDDGQQRVVAPLRTDRERVTMALEAMDRNVDMLAVCEKFEEAKKVANPNYKALVDHARNWINEHPKHRMATPSAASASATQHHPSVRAHVAQADEDRQEAMQEAYEFGQHQQEAFYAGRSQSSSTQPPYPGRGSSSRSPGRGFGQPGRGLGYHPHFEVPAHGDQPPAAKIPAKPICDFWDGTVCTSANKNCPYGHPEGIRK